MFQHKNVCLVDFWTKHGTFNDPIGVQPLLEDNHSQEHRQSSPHKKFNTSITSQPQSVPSSISMSKKKFIPKGNSNNSRSDGHKNRYDDVFSSVDDLNDSKSPNTKATSATNNHRTNIDNIDNHTNDSLSIHSVFDFDKVIELVNKSVDKSVHETMKQSKNIHLKNIIDNSGDSDSYHLRDDSINHDTDDDADKNNNDRNQKTINFDSS